MMYLDSSLEILLYDKILDILQDSEINTTCGTL